MPHVVCPMCHKRYEVKDKKGHSWCSNCKAASRKKSSK